MYVHEAGLKAGTMIRSHSQTQENIPLRRNTKSTAPEVSWTSSSPEYDHLQHLTLLWHRLAPFARSTLRRTLGPLSLDRREIDRLALQIMLTVHRKLISVSSGADRRARILLALEIRRTANELRLNRPHEAVQRLANGLSSAA